MNSGLFRVIVKVIKVAWAFPNSLLGFVVGALAILTGTRLQWHSGTVEFYGGGVAWVLRHLPRAAAGLTLGHVVWGIDRSTLDRIRAHERVHVGQYERWGPLFLPAYFFFCWRLYRQGRDPYWENPFEQEAYDQAG